MLLARCLPPPIVLNALLSDCCVLYDILISSKKISGIDFFLNIVKTRIITIGDDRVCYVFEFVKVV